MHSQFQTWVHSDFVVLTDSTYGPVSVLSDVTKNYVYKSSVSSPSYWIRRKTPAVEVIRPKINLTEYLREPVVPYFSPPRFIVRKEPVKPTPLAFEAVFKKKGTLPTPKRLRKVQLLNTQRNLKYQNRHAQWVKYESRRRTVLSKYQIAYNKRLEKYKRRKLIRDKRLAIVKSWQSKSKRIKSLGHNLPENPYQHTRIELLSGSGGRYTRTVSSAWGELAGYGDWYDYTVAHAVLALPTDDSQKKVLADGLASALYTSLEKEISDDLQLLKLKNFRKLANQKVHYANMLAQRAQTLSLFSDSVRRLATLLKSKKSLMKSLGKYATKPKMIASDFLAFKFGVEPLLSDVYGTAENLADLFIEDNDDITITVRSNRIRNVYKTHQGMRITARLETSMVWKYRIVLGEEQARTLQQLGLVNPAEIAWEVMPWSFVVDWFLPVGQFLNNMTADSGLSWSSGTFSTRISSVVDYDPVGQSVPPPEFPIGTKGAGFQTTSFGSLGPGTYRYSDSRRFVLDEPDRSDVLFLKSPLSWTHGFESLALLVQRIVGKR